MKRDLSTTIIVTFSVITLGMWIYSTNGMNVDSIVGSSVNDFYHKFTIPENVRNQSTSQTGSLSASYQSMESYYLNPASVVVTQ